MFGFVSKKFQSLFARFQGKKVLTPEILDEALLEVKQALLEADVHFSVVETLLERLRERSLGEEKLKGVTPGQQLIYKIHEELVRLMGSEEAKVEVRGKLSVLLLCGLQGSGKTTSCVKLARFLKKENSFRRILLVPCDLQRPAAVEQLRLLAKEESVDVFSLDGKTDPLEIAVSAKAYAAANRYDVVIVDTAGRLHLDEALMQELIAMRAELSPRETFFVANASIGQDAVNVAREFDQKIGMTGVILTMLDGTARAGAALSIREVTQKPLKFEGTGEKISDFQLFHPKSMADRILGMGDVINLVKKTKEHISEEESASLEKKIKKGTISYQDYLKQLGSMRSMGSFSSLIKMMPGMQDLEVSDEKFGRMEAMIQSMTSKEREEKVELEVSRRRRIAKGSGVTLDEVNQLVKGFQRTKQFMKKMPRMGKLPGMQEMKQQLKGMRWH